MLLYCIFLLILFINIASCWSAIYYDLRSYNYTDYDLIIYLLSLQGNINKLSDENKPKLYFQTNLNMQYNADDYWVNIYFPQNKNITFNRNIKPISNIDICTLTNALSTEISRNNISLIIYDHTKYDALQYLALTYCGLYNLLPVTQEMYSNINCLKQIPISQNITNLSNIFSNNLSIYQWMIDNIMSSCNNTLAFSAGKSYKNVNIGGDPGIVLGLDIAISLKAFIFNLSPDPIKYVDQNAMFLKIMNNLRIQNNNDIVEIYGWAEPEPDYSKYVSFGGNVIMCSASPNLSFWNKLQCSNMRLPNRTDINLKLNKTKYYIAFQTNEGDTPKVLDGLYAMTWISSLRGSVPISWGIDPRITRLFPALFQFYATTALYNDSFFAGVSGAGYCYPFTMPNFDIYAKDVNQYLDRYGPQCVDVWPYAPVDPSFNTIPINNYSLYLNYTNNQIQLFTQPPLFNNTYIRNLYINNSDHDKNKGVTPLIMTTDQLFYPQLNTNNPLQDLIDRILSAIQGVEPPIFLVCYGLLPGNNNDEIFELIGGVQHQLMNDEYNLEVVSIDNLAYLAHQNYLE